MTIERFLDCATTMLYEEFLRVGNSVFEAFEGVRTWAASESPAVVSGNGTSAAPEPRPDNDRSMQEFMGQLAGLGGMPG